MSNLKEKLSEKILQSYGDTSTSSEAIAICEAEGTIIPFKKGEENQSSQIVPVMAIGFQEARERIQLLQQFVKDFMKPGQDYGVVPGCSKPSLFKAGAEKLCDIYGFSKLIEVTNRVEDWDKGFFSYEVKVSLINKRTGSMEAEGIGSCNSRERKFCKQDPFSIVNTLLKMAKKRALVDAVLSATRASGLFTQDIEDLQDEITQIPISIKCDSIQYTAADNQNSKNVADTHSYNVTSDISKPKRIQLTDLFALVAQRNISVDLIRNLMLKRYSVTESRALTQEQLEDLYNYLFNSNLK